MWIYEKKLEFPVKIKRCNPNAAKLIITQYGGPDGELGASLRYLSQRFTMVTPQAKAILNDVGTEELAHLEMVGTMVHQLLDGATPKQMQEAGLDSRYVEHGLGIYPMDSGGVPYTAASFQSKGDPITDLYENMAAEQKARSTYEYLLDMIDDEDAAAPLRFLREREVVHFQRFGECLRYVYDYMDSKRQFVIPKPDFLK
ncbi:MAG: manganese catalase family protein [Defluviitaleaceae bacterium]|nr:manganese catalase family protein [Defluviitaleaceae bacterium]